MVRQIHGAGFILIKEVLEHESVPNFCVCIGIWDLNVHGVRHATKKCAFIISFKDQVLRQIYYFSFNCYVKQSYSATTFRALLLLKDRFVKEKLKNGDLALLCDDINFEQQPRRDDSAESARLKITSLEG